MEFIACIVLIGAVWSFRHAGRLFAERLREAKATLAEAREYCVSDVDDRAMPSERGLW